MNVLVIIIVVIAVIVVGVLVAAASTSTEYKIERQVIINRPKLDVFNYVKLLKNQDHYSKWVMTDPNMRKEFRGTDGTVGFIYAWESDNKQVGKGEQEIISIAEGERIDCEVRFMKPFEGKSIISFLVELLEANETQVTWIFNGRRNFMAKIVHMLFNLKERLGRDMEISLERLKNNLEKY
ncbi:MAG TPA: SRPBCC family protein [Parafilimonas sp.]|nr:SRPBCC family protein [Parafilimonas sp.]